MVCSPPQNKRQNRQTNQKQPKRRTQNIPVSPKTTHSNNPINETKTKKNQKVIKKMYINPYTGRKYRTLRNAKKYAKQGKDFPPSIKKQEFIKIIKKFKRPNKRTKGDKTWRENTK